MQQSLASLKINLVNLDSWIYSNTVEIACEMIDAYVLLCEVCILVVALTAYIIK